MTGKSRSQGKTCQSMPEGFFEEKPEKKKRTKEMTIPVVPDFVAGDRPVGAKPAYEDYAERCARTDPDTVTRRIAEDWMPICWKTTEHDHGFYTFKEHQAKIGWNSWVTEQSINEYWRKMKRSQENFQKIELVTSMRYFRIMTPLNDIFKVLRCKAIIEALDTNFDCCDTDNLVFEGQEYECGEELKARRTRNSCPSDLWAMRRDGILNAIRVVKTGIEAPEGSPDRELAAEVCHNIRIINSEMRDVVANIVHDVMKKDAAIKKRYITGWQSQKEWDRLVENVEWNDAFESKRTLMDRKHNGAHCSYFHRWFQHPIWRLSQARVGNGPYTRANAFEEPVTHNYEIANSNALPDLPSRNAFATYQKLLNNWEKKIDIPVGTPRPLGAPAFGEAWDDRVAREGFKSLTGITPNMLEWIVETALEEANDHPHPNNMVGLNAADEKDKYGRLTRKGQYDMLFSYVSGEEYDYQTVHFWFEKDKMVTSLSYKNESDPVNGEQVRKTEQLKRERERERDMMLMSAEEFEC
eukprot:5712096-Amphidinium_carterae.1